MTRHKSVQYAVYCDFCTNLEDYAEYIDQRAAEACWRKLGWQCLADGRRWRCPNCQQRTTRLRRPDGELIEEFALIAHWFAGLTTPITHLFEGGELVQRGDRREGVYTKRFCYKHAADGRRTRWYTERSAPKWLLALYQEVTTDNVDTGRYLCHPHE